MENSEKTVEKIGRVAGDLKVTDITPENLKDEIPVLLIQGWGESPKTHEDTLKVIAKEGRRVIAVQIPRIGGVKPEGNYPEAEYTKARAYVDAINKKEIKTIDIIAHSEGALSAIIATEIFASQNQHHRIRNIVFVEPVGLIGKDNLKELRDRWITLIKKDREVYKYGSPIEKQNLRRAASEAAKYIIRNPLRTLREARAISASDIYESLAYIQEKGIGVVVIHAVDDTLFPMERVKIAGKGQIDKIITVKGDHREISVHPEKYAALAIDALDDLIKKENLII